MTERAKSPDLPSVNNSLTDEALLKRVARGQAQSDWAELFQKYSGIILRFCRSRGLDDASAKDVLQETMVELVRLLPGFDYQRERGRFRNYVLKIAVSKQARSSARAARAKEVEGEFARIVESDAPVREDWRHAVFADVLARLRADGTFNSKTWAIFDDYVMRRQPVEAVAVRHGRAVSAIYAVKNRILRRVRLEASLLIGDQD